MEPGAEGTGGLKSALKPELKPKTSACYVCGPENASGLQVPFSPDGEHGARARYTARAEHCGWPGLLHGGVAFALLDEALAWAVYFQGLYGVTARVETRFRQPITVGTPLEIRAWTLERHGKLLRARAEMRSLNDENPLVAEATATMYLQDLEKVMNG